MPKQLLLRDAVNELVEPGHAVHFSFTHNRSHVLAYEVARRFAGETCLDLIATGLLDYAIVLEAAGAVRAGLGAFAGTTYPAAAPSPPMRALVARDGSDPHWTNLTVTLRLMAGALGLPAIPTRSLAGTNLAEGPGRASIANPFGDGALMLLEPLAADVAFVHVPVADTDGNAVVQGPMGEDLWGVWGAKRVIVSADEVVAPHELRRMTPSVGLPASLVDAVVHAPYGAHPQAQLVWDPRITSRPYAEDYCFRDDLRAAARKPPTLQRWLRDWVLGVDHDAYLGRLGAARLEALHVAVCTPSAAPAGAMVEDVSPSEAAAVNGVRWLVDRLQRDRRPQRPLFAGIGLAHLVAFAAARSAARLGVPAQLVAEVGMVGFEPPDGDPYLFSAANAGSAVIHADFVRMLGAVGGPRDHGTIAVLAAGQIDHRGRLNSTQSADGGFIVGSGGANDLASGAAELLVVVPLSKRRTVAKLPFVTAAPRRLQAVATDHGLLEPNESGELLLTAVVARSQDELHQAVKAAQTACGWPLQVANDLQRLDPPADIEVAMLRALDPQRRLLR